VHSLLSSVARRKQLGILPLAILLGLISLPGAAVAAPGRMEKAFETTLDPQVMLNNLRGQVVVRGWDRPQVHADCATQSPHVEMDAETIPHTGPAERVELAAHVLDPLVTGDAETVDCTLIVPIGASIEIKNRQGSVQIERIRGLHVWVESAGGRLSATDVTGHLVARSLGGDIEIIRASGRVEAVSITGTLRFVHPTSKNLRGNTNSGKITFLGDFAPGGDYVLSTYSGDIEVLCPETASFELKARTVKGKLDNAVRLTPRRHPVTPLGVTSSLLGTRNTGNAIVDLTSFSGTIRLRQQR